MKTESKRGKKTALLRGRRIGVYPGQYYDPETGLHYNYFRYYDPATGRYITPDPIGLEGGINLFTYVENNPVRFKDPEGLAVPLVVGGIAACIANPACATALAALSAATLYYAQKATYEILNQISFFKRGPEPEGYPGERKGKEVCELNKSLPKPVPPEKNPPPPPPKKSWKQKLLEDIADLLDMLFGG